MHALEIIGEAATRVPESVRGAHAEVPWKQMTGMRNALIHGYWAIEAEVIWKTVHEDLPGLEVAMRRVLGEIRD